MRQLSDFRFFRSDFLFATWRMLKLHTALTAFYSGLLCSTASLAEAVLGQHGLDPSNHSHTKPPNVIVILADDLGYGDLGSYGHSLIKTPRLDRMADEGQRWTNFYAAAPDCTPSRAGLLTGKLPVRIGMASTRHRVLFPWSQGGLPQQEITLAEQLREQGYATKMVGKWHLGHLPEYLPTRHGFDSWFGIPYSNDMDKTDAAKTRVKQDRQDGIFPSPFWYQAQSDQFRVPLMQDNEILELAPDQALLTQRYTEQSIEFIRQNAETPFFLYLAHSMPHVPLFASEEFLGQSEAGLYGDVIEEIDHSVGRILDALSSLGLDQRTLVVFTSDNGPWLKYKDLGGSSGMLREGKSTTWEGGMRVPAIFWGPGIVEPDTVDSIGSTLDFMNTFAALANHKSTDSKLVDSYNLLPLLMRSASDASSDPRQELFYYSGDRLTAIRRGPYKVHYFTRSQNTHRLQPQDPPLLFNLDEDPGEQKNIAAQNPSVIEAFELMKESHLAAILPRENQLLKR